MKNYQAGRRLLWRFVVAAVCVGGCSAALHGQQPALTAEYAENVTALASRESVEAYVAFADPFWKKAQSELDGAEREAVRVAVADGAKAWLLTEGVARNAKPEQVEWLLARGIAGIEDDSIGPFVTEWLKDPTIIDRLTTHSIELLVTQAARRASPDEKKALQELLEGALSGVEELSFEQLEKRIKMTAPMSAREYAVKRQRRELVAQWADGKDPASLDNSVLNELVFGYLPPATRGDQSEQVIVYTGSVTPPRSGDYQFSTGPYRISTKYGDSVHRQAAEVSIDGQVVLTAQPDNWPDQSDAVWLEGGKAVSVRAEYRYETVNAPSRTFVAQLYWQGPGLQSQLVAADDEYLVEATYVDADGAAHLTNTTEPLVDQSFFESVPCAYNKVFNGLISEKVERLLDPTIIQTEYIDEFHEAGKPARPHVFLAPGLKHGSLLKYCSSASRREILETLRDYPLVVQNATLPGVCLFYQRVRIGAEQEAMGVLSTWMKSNPDWSAGLSGRNWRGDPRTYHSLIVALAWELPGSFDEFEALCLETDDGHCSLPAAYTVAYGKLQQGQLMQWIGELEERLADEQLTGDRRVNWLIARAMAEEIRYCPAERHYTSQERPLAGDEWLQEALFAANSPAARTRVEKEWLARLVASGDFDAAEEYLAEMTGDTRACDQFIKQSRQAQATRSEQERLASEAASLAELKRRRQSAEDRGDAATDAQYQELIKKVEAKTAVE